MQRTTASDHFIDSGFYEVLNEFVWGKCCGFPLVQIHNVFICQNETAQ